MIVNPTDNGWEIIYHRAHALLAAQLGGHWRNSPDRPSRLIETVAAISHHDDLEREWEGNHLTAAGAPQDFTLSHETSVDKLYQEVEDAQYRGRWVALLTSMHMSFLNEPSRGQSPELDQFLDQQLAQQKQWRRELQVSKEEAASAYAFMQWCDRLSLILCRRELPERERALEISKGPDGQRYDVRQWSNGTVTVEPWPFQPKEFTVNVEATYLTKNSFKSNPELVKALQSSPIEILTWNFVK